MRVCRGYTHKILKKENKWKRRRENKENKIGIQPRDKSLYKGKTIHILTN